MQLRREWFVNDWFVCEDEPPLLGHCGWSAKWMCSRCGVCYATMRAFVNDSLQPYKFLSGLCRHCFHYGHNRLVPGLLEASPLLAASFPEPIQAYQIEVELTFLSHPLHPHNKDHDHAS